MDTSCTNTRDSLAKARRDTTPWARLSRAEQIRAIELEGYAVLPGILSAEAVAALRAELARLPTRAVDYSPHQRGCRDVQWTDSPRAIATIAHPPVVDLLRELFGDDLICTSCSLAVSEPGHPGIAIHTDAQPYGSRIFGLQSSSPVLARVLYYLDDLTSECSPFKVVPRSHLSLHADGNPYRRYLSHPDEVMVCCPAGSAVVINQKVFHGNYPNYSDCVRRMLAIAYRPAWAGPIGPVAEHDPARVALLPEPIRPFFGSPNTRATDIDVPNRPDGMARQAAGINPGRWGSP